jgi:hypothetical protein
VTELARLAAVVEAEGKPQEMPVQLVAEVVLDPSACRPEIMRRPSMSAPRRGRADDRCDQEYEDRRVRFIRLIVTTPVSWHEDARDRTIASRDEATSDVRYGRRNVSRRATCGPAGARRVVSSSRPSTPVGYGSCTLDRCSGAFRAESAHG